MQHQVSQEQATETLAIISHVTQDLLRVKQQDSQLCTRKHPSPHKLSNNTPANLQTNTAHPSIQMVAMTRQCMLQHHKRKTHHATEKDHGKCYGLLTADIVGQCAAVNEH